MAFPSFFGNNRAVKKLVGWRQSDEDEKFATKAVEALMKKLKNKKNSIKDLQFALANSEERSNCVTIPRSMDGRLQVSHKKALPHIIYCKIWRWPDIQSHHEIKAIESCKYAFERKEEEVCINPYHYKRIERPTLPPILVPNFSEQEFTIQQQMFFKLQSPYMPQTISSSYTDNTLSGTTNTSAGIMNTSAVMKNTQPPSMMNTTTRMMNIPTGMMNSPTSIANISNGMMNSPSGMMNSPTGMMNIPTGMMNTSTGMVNTSSGIANSSPGMMINSDAMTDTIAGMKTTSLNKNELNMVNSTNNQIFSNNSGNFSNNVGNFSNNTGNFCNNVGNFTNNVGNFMNNMGNFSNNLGYFSHNMGNFSNVEGDVLNNSYIKNQNIKLSHSNSPYDPPAYGLTPPNTPPPAYSPGTFCDGKLTPVHYQDTPNWSSITYYELSKACSTFHVKKPFVQVDGFTDTSNCDRFCIGALSNVDRNSSIENTRNHIGKGVIIGYIGGDVFVECVSENPVFIHSRILNLMHNFDCSTVVKLLPGTSIKVFNEQIFADLLSKSVYKDYETVSEMIKFCVFRLSFVKGWGSNYFRKDITWTPCWIEVQLQGALKWVDKVLTQMGPPAGLITSVS